MINEDLVDDEPLAIERLQILCAGIAGVGLVGTASDGAAALRLIEALSPDLLLLDIAMPGLDGLAVAQALEAHPAPPAIIFCTAFDQFAIAAFDVAAVDYLLKPVAPERLARAIARVAAKHGAGVPEAAAPAWLEEFWVPYRSEVIRVAAADVDRVDAERDYMRLHIGARSFLLHQTITELERRLDPAGFIRLHRSTIVRCDLIAGLRHDGLGTWYAALLDGGEAGEGGGHGGCSSAAPGGGSAVRGGLSLPSLEPRYGGAIRSTPALRRAAAPALPTPAAVDEAPILDDRRRLATIIRR